MDAATCPVNLFPPPGRTWWVVVAVLVTVGVAAPTVAQSTQPPRQASAPDRPQVGLVLSGGAAKGIAHIGVLRILEEAGLPVDVVTGTSMGAVVGGLYATGYTPDQLSTIARGSDWSELFAGQPERRALLLEEQLTGRGALATLPVEDGTIRLPSGLLSGQDVFELLTRLTWPVHTTWNFRELPRAFAAVAVELETGEAVRFDSGSLPLAIRASLSLPSLFEPVRIDGRRFIDGGVARNLPAEDAQALGADLLVCVDVSAEDETAGPPSFLDVIAEAAFYRNQRSAPAQRARCDVIIEPDVQELSPFAFEEAEAWIERGEAAARETLPELRALADSLDTVDESTPPAAPPARTSVSSQRRLAPDSAGTKAPRRVVAVDVRGVTGAAEELARRRLGLRPPASLTVDQIEAAIERVYALDAFRMVTYRLQPVRTSPEGAPPEETAAEGPAGAAESTEAYVLIVEPEASPADRLRVGLRYDTDNKAALYGSLSLRHLLRYGSTTQLGVRLGEETQLEAGYRARLQSGRHLGLDVSAVAGGQLRFTRLPVRLSFDDRPPPDGGDAAPADLAATLDLYRGQILLGRTLGERLLVGTLLSVEHARAEPEVGPDSIGAYTETFSSATALALTDTRNRRSVPSRGVRLDARGELATGLLGGPIFQHVSVDGEGLLPLGRGLSLYGRTVWTQGYGRDLPRHYRTVLGGVEVLPLLPGRRFPLYGTDPQALVGRAGQLAAAGVQWTRSGHWFSRLTAHAGRVGDDWVLDPAAFTTGVGLTVGTATLIGPLRLTLTNDDLRDLPQITLSAGHTF